MDDTEYDPVTPEALVDLPVPDDIQVSPNSCAPLFKAGEHTLRSLWIAHTERSIRHVS